MNKITHLIYVWSMALVVIAITVYLTYVGYSYYELPLVERFYHPQYDWFKPSGDFGQGLGVIGTFLIAFGVTIYILRKRYGVLERFIRLKYLLEFHIFLCTLGPILILFHTTFKFGGIVSVAFWSMVAVVLSGVVGRFIYIQIPRSIEGRELSLQEVIATKDSLLEKIKGFAKGQDQIISFLHVNESGYFKNLKRKSELKKLLRSIGLGINEQKEVMSLAKEQMALASRIGRLLQMQKLFKYWHVVHMPFAIIMLIIVIVHVVVTVSLGYKWIF